MKKNSCKAYALAFAVVLLFSVGCQKSMNNNSPASAKENGANGPSPKEFKDFVQVNLVGNNAKYNPRKIDANLINGWGLDFPATGNIRVAVEGTGKGSFYTLDGDIAATPINIPTASTSDGDRSHPTGHTCNGSADFKLANGNPAQSIFASADGAINGWNSGSTAVRMIDNSPSASYSGVAIANDAGNNYIYAANFRQGRIDVFDKEWKPVSKPFSDPGMPAGYSPFNVQNVGGKLYVSYAKVDPTTGEEQIGNGKGYINVFSSNGALIKRFASGGKLNAPWGMVKAPPTFWGSHSELANMILVANFGDGRINIYDESGNYLGQLYSMSKAIEINGLWGIAFPPPSSFNSSYLYFAAGPNNETEGLFGYIKNAYLN